MNVQVEREGVARAITLARVVNVPLYFVHILSQDAMEEIAHARILGFIVFLGTPRKVISYIDLTSLLKVTYIARK